jgi:hypothetical protein
VTFPPSVSEARKASSDSKVPSRMGTILFMRHCAVSWRRSKPSCAFRARCGARPPMNLPAELTSYSRTFGKCLPGKFVWEFVVAVIAFRGVAIQMQTIPAGILHM